MSPTKTVARLATGVTGAVVAATALVLAAAPATAMPTTGHGLGAASTPVGSPAVTLTAFEVPSACGYWAQKHADYAEDHGHPQWADRLDDRADRRADRQGCD